MLKRAFSGTFSVLLVPFFVHSSAFGNTCADVAAKKTLDKQLTKNSSDLPKELVQFPEPSPWIKAQSAKTIERLNQAGLAKVEAQVGSFGYKQAVQETFFQKGSLYNEGGSLMWKKSDGQIVKLVDKTEHPDRDVNLLSVSPDGGKIAYSTTLSGSDQHLWYVKTIEDTPQALLDEPILVRMDGFSWGKDSETVYYSYFSPIEKVINKTAPAQVVRSRNLKTGKDQLILDHGTQANFAVFDVDGGETLIAHRILGPGSGIKALLSLYMRTRIVGGPLDGLFKWNSLIPSNEYMGHFLGVIERQGQKFAIVHSNQFSKRYGISMIALDGSNKATKLFTPEKGWVLHNSQMHDGQIFAEYYNPKTLVTQMRIVDAQTGQITETIDFTKYGLLPYGSLNLPVSFNKGDVTFKYVDYFGNARVFQYSLNKRTLLALDNPAANPFNAQNVRVTVDTYKSADGTRVRGLKFFNVNTNGEVEKPKFFYLKSYGMIGIKSAAEPLEIQMTLARGGVYFAPDIRGGAGPNSDWQVAGSQKFELRFQDIESAAYYLTAKDPLFAKFGLDPKESVVAVGRSYNGAGMLSMAARSPEMAKMFVSIVPVWDAEKMLKTARFGVIAASDRFPAVDPVTRDLVLDREFWREVRKHSPARSLKKIPKDTLLYVYTGGRDDRVDQLNLEEGFAQLLSNQLGENFKYIQNPTASHIPRWYIGEVFTEIDLVFGTTLP